MKKWFLAILPPKPILEKIINIQIELKNSHGFKHALKTPPHITVISPFLCDNQKIHQLIQGLNTNQFNSFMLELDGFQAFHPRVIFIDVKRNDKLYYFAEKVKAIFSIQNIVSNKGDKHSYLPHITIANRDLNNKTFKQIFPQMKDREFYAKFECHSIVLLGYDNQKWQIIEDIKF